jgi:hypothetical protein
MKALGVLFAIGALRLAGCAGTRGYNGAFRVESSAGRTGPRVQP